MKKDTQFKQSSPRLLRLAGLPAWLRSTIATHGSDTGVKLMATLGTEPGSPACQATTASNESGILELSRTITAVIWNKEKRDILFPSQSECLKYQNLSPSRNHCFYGIAALHHLCRLNMIIPQSWLLTRPTLKKIKWARKKCLPLRLGTIPLEMFLLALRWLTVHPVEMD